ncbi:MAG: HupE/UreJ family protein [Burkholderiales bacterium]|nr:HupE/UreJ family protein [Burkholderiales bacterium]
MRKTGATAAGGGELSRWLALLLLLASFAVQAHKPSDSYLRLKIDGAQVSGQWDIALRDLEQAIGLDANGDGEITWGELRARQSDIGAYALARLSLSGDGENCPLRVSAHQVDHHSDGAYEVLRFAAECAAAPAAIEIGYSLFFDFDAQHKGLLNLEYQGKIQSLVFSPGRSKQRFELGEMSSFRQFLSYAREGVWHIWIGYDHILFLVSLLLPAVLLRERKHWSPVARFPDAFWDVFKIVTSFTVAHSITLSLAALGVISLPSRLVESAIAASVVLAALNNLLPVVGGRRWVVAFAFGLIHGFGFASVLTELGLPRDALVLALVGFNLGVEGGQLTIVAAFLPLAYALRESWFYRRVVLFGGSIAIVTIAMIWLLERALNLKLITP